MAMTDRELLERAARAAGLPDYFDGIVVSTAEDPAHTWNPLTDDGDALRLAVKLGMELDFSNGSTAAADPERYSSTYKHEFHAGDAMARTRRAIVRAAAAMAKED